MKKIEFVNGHAPYLNEENLNQLQDNMEEVSVPEGGTQGQVLTKASNTDNDIEWKTLETVPIGGTTGQSLVKKSNTDNDVEWKSLATVPEGGTTKQVLAKKSNTDYDIEWTTLPEIAVLTGSFTITAGIGSTNVASPTGFTKDNCAVISQMYQNTDSGLSTYTSGYMSDTSMVIHGMLVILGKPDGTDNDHIYIQSEGTDTTGTFLYKIVLMKVS